MPEAGRVAVLGAGIAGLTAGFHLTRRGHDVIVLEAAPRAGGVIASERTDGYLLEHGANSTHPTAELRSLIEFLGIHGEVVQAAPAQRNRFVVRDGILVPLPRGPGSFVRSRLFSARGKFRLLMEPFVRPGRRNESVAEFVSRRVGREFLDYAIDPFVAGVFAGSPHKLSMKHTFPKMVEIEQAHGSLLRGLAAREWKSKKTTQTGRERTPFSFRDGMSTLPNALATALGDRLKLQAPVRAVERANGSWRVLTEAGEFTVDAVISSVPTHDFGRIGVSLVRTSFLDVEYAPITVVGLGYRRQEVGHPLDGFGFLVPAVEQDFRLLGALFSSSLFPNRAPEGHILLTGFLGGARYAKSIKLTDAAAIDVASADIQVLLETRGAPSFRRVIQIPKAIPQYHLGYDETLDKFAKIERELPGLFFTGNYCRGVSVGDTVSHAVRTAARIHRYLSTDPPGRGPLRAGT